MACSRRALLYAVMAALCVLPLCAVPAGARVERTNLVPGLGDYTAPFFPDAVYRDRVDSPSKFLGFDVGSRPARYAEAVAYFEYLAETFPNVSLTEYGETWEGRRLIYLTITSEANAKRLPELKKEIAKLADPRLLSGGGEAEKIIAGTPAVAWLVYSIHGDEFSSTDAAIWLAYHLVAGEDELSRKIRDEVIVCIDPLQNPDGRERWIKQMESWNGVVTNDDVQSIQHRGLWPYGRGNHYQFDLNRDWITLTQPETRGRAKAVLEWHPQYFTDSHEMGPLDTYLFSPPREPFNPFLIPQIYKWWKIFSTDQAAAFDRYGWSYYTREWNEEIYPGYGSSWSIYTGAVGLLYEQAGVDGSIVKRPDGTVMTYRETVHHQFTSSLANLGTVANHRAELLEDFYKEKKSAVGGGGERGRHSGGRSAAYVFPPSANEARLERLIETLQGQDIEVAVATKSFKVRSARPSTGKPATALDLPAGTYIVPLAQPLRALAETILAFDIRLPTKFLEVERKEILEKNDTKLYETTAWSLPLAYGVECYYVEDLPGVDTALPEKTIRGGLANPSPKFGYVFDMTDDRAYSLLARLFEEGVEVWCAREPFEVEGRKFPRGSILVKRSANPRLEAEEVEKLAHNEGVDVYGVNTALAAEGADLGGGEFRQLEPPRVGIVAGPEISLSDFGPIWHLLDARLRYRTSILDVLSLGQTDLRKYNVLVFPSTWGGPDVYQRVLGKPGIEKIKTWVESGGTLVAMGAGSAFATDTTVALSAVRQKSQVLKKLAEYDRALVYAKEAATPDVDSVDVWEKPREPEKKEEKKTGASAADNEKKPGSPDFEALKDADETARKLRPRGAILAVDLDEKHWLSFGVKSPVPILIDTDQVYLAKTGIQVAGRFAPRDRVRLSGLLWPEARERWSETAFATREGRGSGQIVLFADTPNFRAYFHGGERMLLNAIFLGPGFGTNPSFY